jgi:VIT1/CCC1 family predicted Fe2+/Mn2+ transporter
LRRINHFNAQDFVMPTVPHLEKHFTATETVRDVVIGMADGLTVPFALAAGLSAAVSSTSVIVTAGLAEIAAGAIAMGLGGYLAARTDAQHFASERVREEVEIETKREFEVDEVRQVFAGYGLGGASPESVVASITSDRKRWTDFMMRFELGLDEPDPKRAPISAATIGVSYMVGGLIPLLPYMLTGNLTDALRMSVLTIGVALLIFGGVKGHFTGVNRLVSAGQTLLVGGLAAAAAFGLAHLFG